MTAFTNPLYQIMIEDLIYQIEAGKLPANTKLPSEAALGDHYQVSRITVRRALAELVQRHYIEKKQGQGSYVLSAQHRDSSLHYLSLGAAIREMGAVLTRQVQQLLIVGDNRDPQLRQQLALKEDAYYYDIRCRYLADHQPTASIHLVMAYAPFPGLTQSELENRDLVPLLVSKYGIASQDVHYTTVARRVNRQEAPLLAANWHDPLLEVSLTGYEQQRLVFTAQTLIVGDLPLYLIHHAQS